jgi:hypothetical protein
MEVNRRQVFVESFRRLLRGFQEAGAAAHNAEWFRLDLGMEPAPPDVKRVFPGRREPAPAPGPGGVNTLKEERSCK